MMAFTTIALVVVQTLFMTMHVHAQTDVPQCNIYDDITTLTVEPFPSTTPLHVATTQTATSNDNDNELGDDTEDLLSGSGSDFVEFDSTTMPIVTTTASTVTATPRLVADPPFCIVLTESDCADIDTQKACPRKCSATASPTSTPTSTSTLTPTTTPSQTPTIYMPIAASRCECTMQLGGVWQFNRCLHACFAVDESECNSSTIGCSTQPLNSTNPPKYSSCQCSDNPNIDNCAAFASEGCCEGSVKIRELCQSSCGRCTNPDMPRPALQSESSSASDGYKEDLSTCKTCVNNNGGIFNTFDESTVTDSRCLRTCLTADENCFESVTECQVFAEVRQAAELCQSVTATDSCGGCTSASVGCGWVWSATHLQGSCVDVTKAFPFRSDSCGDIVLASDPKRSCDAPTLSPTLSPTISPTVSTASPTISPTLSPTISPTISPMVSTASPTTSPTTTTPSLSPSGSLPTVSPTTSPTTNNPSVSPSVSPTVSPQSTSPTMPPTTTNPSMSPSVSHPTSSPTNSPTQVCTTISCENGGTCFAPPSDELDDELASGSGEDEDETTSGSGSEDLNWGENETFKCVCPQGSFGVLCELTDSPTITSPTSSPTPSPTVSPTVNPSTSPTTSPTTSPLSSSPTSNPTPSPTQSPSSSTPSTTPTSRPSTTPSNVPSQSTASPSRTPTRIPTESPSTSPTRFPSSTPTVPPTSMPTTSQPTQLPSVVPTKLPTHFPTTSDFTPPPTTNNPSVSPSVSPTVSPTPTPTEAPMQAITSTTTTATATTTMDLLASSSSNDFAMSSTIVIAIVIGSFVVILLIVVVIQWRNQKKSEEFAPKPIDKNLTINGTTVPARGFAGRTMVREPSSGILMFAHPGALNQNISNPVFNADPNMFDV